MNKMLFNWAVYEYLAKTINQYRNVRARKKVGDNYKSGWYVVQEYVTQLAIGSYFNWMIYVATAPSG